MKTQKEFYSKVSKKVSTNVREQAAENAVEIEQTLKLMKKYLLTPSEKRKSFDASYLIEKISGLERELNKTEKYI